MTPQVIQFAEFLGPLLAGLLFGSLSRRYVFPRVLARAEPLVRLVATRGNRVASVILGFLWLGLALACYGSNATEVLAWLQAHPGVSVKLTPSLLRLVSMAAAFMGGSTLSSIPSQAYVDELSGRRPSAPTTNDAPPT